MAAQSASELVTGAAVTGGGAAFGNVGLVFGFWVDNCGLLVGWKRREAGIARTKDGQVSNQIAKDV